MAQGILLAAGVPERDIQELHGILAVAPLFGGQAALVHLVGQVKIVIERFQVGGVESAVAHGGEQPADAHKKVGGCAHILGHSAQTKGPAVGLQAYKEVGKTHEQSRNGVARGIQDAEFPLAGPLKGRHGDGGVIFQKLELVVHPHIQRLFVIPTYPHEEGPEPVAPAALLLDIRAADARAGSAHRREPRHGQDQHQHCRNTERAVEDCQRAGGHPGREQPHRQHRAAQNTEYRRGYTVQQRHSVRIAAAAEAFALLDEIVEVVDLLAVLVGIIHGHLLFHKAVMAQLPVQLFPLHALPVEQDRPHQREQSGHAQHPRHIHGKGLRVPRVRQLSHQPGREPDHGIGADGIRQCPQHGGQHKSGRIFPVKAPGPQGQPDAFLQGHFFFVHTALPSL